MPKRIFFLIILFQSVLAMAQIKPGREIKNIDDRILSNRFEENERDSLVPRKTIKVELSGKTHYTDYKVFTRENDTTIVDTTLSISKYYKFNFLKRDLFEYQEFANQGQPLTTLAHNFRPVYLYPKFGATAKHFGFYEVEDMRYFQVPTPTTILMYRTGIEQGQTMDGFFTFNYSKQFNMSIAFNGLHSLGDYRYIVSDFGILRITSNYHTKDFRYQIKAHVAAQEINNQENGGLTPESIANFENGLPNFKDRARLETNFTDADNSLRSNRYFFDHNFRLWNESADTLKQRSLSNLRIGHVFNYEIKHYEFTQKSSNNFFGPAFKPVIDDRPKLEKLYNEVYVNFNSPFVLGNFRVNVQNYNYNYGYNRKIINEDGVIEPRLSGNVMAAGASWNTGYKKFHFKATASTIFSGPINGNLITGEARFDLDSISNVYAGLHLNNRSPDFNYMLYQSDYRDYNWQTNFKNEGVSTLFFGINSSKWFDASVDVTRISSYTYFGKKDDDEQPKPYQFDGSVGYFKVKVAKEFRFGKFALDNSIIYQNVLEGNEVFSVPQFITRNSLYFNSHLFKGNPLQLQTGITFKYFTKYYMREYNPLMAEFTFQDQQKFGGYPMFDFFINAEVSRVRMYLLFQHFNSSFTGYNYYSAPTYPYRDFKIRFGLVWNFFI